MEHSSSPDELANDLSPGVSRSPDTANKTSEVVSSRSPSPVKSSSLSRKATSAKGVLTGLPPSNFSISTFDHSASRRATSKNLARHDKEIEGSEQDREFRLAAVNVGGKMLKSTDLGLVFNPRTTSFEVFQGPSNLATSDASLQIHPHRVHKAFWSGAKIRFHSARSGTSDSVLDIVLWGEKECQSLLETLQDGRAHKLRVEHKDE